MVMVVLTIAKTAILILCVFLFFRVGGVFEPARAQAQWGFWFSSVRVIIVHTGLRLRRLI
jgi:hypothetical protein